MAKKDGGNPGKLLLPITLGVCVTLFAATVNHFVHGWRLALMVSDNRISRRRTDPARGAHPEASRLNVQQILTNSISRIDDMLSSFMLAFRKTGGDAGAERVALVAVDKESVIRFGGWPWPRSEVARLVDKTAGASAVGLDYLFNEPDRTSLGNYITMVDQRYNLGLDLSKWDPEELDNDLRLAGAISRNRIVLGVKFYDGDYFPSSNDSPIVKYKLNVSSPTGKRDARDDILLRQSRSVMYNIGILRRSQAAPLGEGFMDLFPDLDSAVRHVPLFALSVNDSGVRRIYPSFPLEMARVALGGDGYLLRLRDELVDISEPTGDPHANSLSMLREVGIVDESGRERRELLRIPLNELGEMGLGLRNDHRSFKVYPAWEVLKGMHDGAFKDKLVVIGRTDDEMNYIAPSGIFDIEISLAEGHAAVLSAMLEHNHMIVSFRVSYLWQQAAIAFFGLAATAAMAAGSMGVCLAASALSLPAAFLVNYFFFFRHGVEMGMTTILASILFFMVIQLIASYLLAGRERHFIREAFSLNVSPAVLGYLEKHHDNLSSLQGENRNMSVIFTDIRGFTSISEKMLPQELAQFLNEYFTPMSDIVMRRLGTIDKFIGDGLMAFWNAPADNPDHARDAALAALDMIAKLAELQPAWTAKGLPKISIGCGINTGFMLAGYMGSEQRKNYTVMGDSVNIASRVENLNKVYSSNILITESTRAALGSDFSCRVVDKVRVSGKQTPILIHELLRHGEITDEEREELAVFSRVFELYLEWEFVSAEALLKELMFIRQAPIYSLYLNRLAIYKVMPPPPDWDGTFSMRSK
ncbi:MAG: adenylate/guanylate cyclase domain-containing protein [Planctomycetota bacterium]|jgi:adenylate cyclase|nr:adenylate/guanylate cyclase domain-containing protein [Planctomycetota bacterium]